jgi:hypothetical protein
MWGRWNSRIGRALAGLFWTGFDFTVGWFAPAIASHLASLDRAPEESSLTRLYIGIARRHRENVPTNLKSDHAFAPLGLVLVADTADHKRAPSPRFRAAPWWRRWAISPQQALEPVGHA